MIVVREMKLFLLNPVGVGLIETSINLTRMCLFDKPEYLLLLEVQEVMVNIKF